jgi:hypothetical protein
VPLFDPAILCFPLHYGGGGVCISSGRLNLTEAEVRGNYSENHGGGVLIGESASMSAVSTNYRENTSLRSGGAFSNFGTTTVSDSSISDNSAPAGGGVRNTGEVPGVNGLLAIENTTIENNDGSIGGGIDNGFGGHLTVDGSTIAGNTAATGGGIYNSGGIPQLQADHSEMTLRDSVVRGNSAVFGAGIYAAGNDSPGVATIERVSIADNTSSRSGGGLYNTGILTLTASTITANTAVVGGGGLFNAGLDVIPAGIVAKATLTNSTISGNTGQTGGGIRNGGDLTATNVTVARNAAETGGNFWRSGLDTSDLQNTILADPQSGANCADPPPFSLGHNLDSDGTCALARPGDISKVDPLLEPLADNGGPTLTHMIRGASPAIDAGDDSACPDTDQTGFFRPWDGDGDGVAECDIGSVETHIIQGPPVVPGPTTPAPSASPNTTPAAVLPAAFPRTGDDASSHSPIPVVVVVVASLLSVGSLRWLYARLKQDISSRSP